MSYVYIYPKMSRHLLGESNIDFIFIISSYISILTDTEKKGNIGARLMNDRNVVLLSKTNSSERWKYYDLKSKFQIKNERNIFDTEKINDFTIEKENPDKIQRISFPFFNVPRNVLLK